MTSKVDVKEDATSEEWDIFRTYREKKKIIE